MSHGDEESTEFEKEVTQQSFDNASSLQTVNTEIFQETNKEVKEEEEEEELEYESQDEEEFETCYADNQDIDEVPLPNDFNAEDNQAGDIINEEEFENEFEHNEDRSFIDLEREEQNLAKEFVEQADILDRELLQNSESDKANQKDDLEVANKSVSAAKKEDYVNVFSDSEDEIKVTKEVNTDVSNNVDEAIEINDDDESEGESQYVNLSDEEEEEKHEEYGDASNYENDEYDDFEKGIDLVGKLSKLRVYFDFCDLTNSLDQLGNMELQQIKPDFDILKLFKLDPTVKEDDEYSELGCICGDFEECVNLTFDELFRKLSELLNIDLNKVVIHLSISDLLDFSVSSDLKSSLSIHVRDVLEIYETLKNQSPNSDLYKFLSIKVWCTQSIKEQIKILQSVSKAGYHLGNIKQINLKRKLEENETSLQQRKKPSLNM